MKQQLAVQCNHMEQFAPDVTYNDLKVSCPMVDE